MANEQRLGGRGAEVRTLHQSLQRLGGIIAVGERHAEEFGASTEAALRNLQRGAGLPENGVLDAATAKAIADQLTTHTLPAEFRVRGVIRRRDGSPVVGATVNAEDRDLFATQTLGTARTDADGRYQISFQRSAFTRAERPGPDLVVHAVGAGLEARSAIYFNAGPDTVVDLVLGGGVYGGPSEWTRFVAALTPLLDGHSASELNDSHIDFIVGETDFAREIVEAYVASVHIADQARAQDSPVPVEAVYAVLRAGGPAAIALLALTSEARLRKGLVLAEGGVIPDYGDAWLASTLQAFAALRQRVAGASPLGELGKIAGLSGAAATRFADRYVTHSGPIETLWASLREDPEMAPQIPRLQRLGHLSSLARGHLPLVRALEAQYQATQAQSLGGFLASIDDAAWLAHATELGTPADLSALDYASLLSATVEEAFPTHVVLRHLTGVELPHGEAVTALLRHEQWERLEKVLPRRKSGPAPKKDEREFVEAVIFRAKTGIPWRDLPERFGPWKTIYNKFSRWAAAGAWEAIYKALRVRVDKTGSIVDGSNVRAHQDAAGEKGGSTETHWVVLEVDSPRKSMRSSTRKAGRSTSR